MPNDIETEPDLVEEREADKEDREEEQELKRLRENKSVNYAMIRNLRPITGPKPTVFQFSGIFWFLDKKIMKFREWHEVEEGKIQIRESIHPKSDPQGYVVVRPNNEPEREIILRMWGGWINSAVILPRSDDPLPRQGPQKEKILRQMELVDSNSLPNYQIWLDRMKKASEHLINGVQGES